MRSAINSATGRIAGGAEEMLRNTIAPAKGVPFNQIPAK